MLNDGTNGSSPGDADKLAPEDDSDAVIAEAKAYLQLCIQTDGDNRDSGLEDLRFLAGDHWSDKDKRQRQIDRRPCLTINKLPTFLHQVTNDQRQNVPSIKVSPVDSSADVKTAEVIQGMVRHIEYSSNADVAYDTAVNSAAAIGFGYFRLTTDYCDESSFDQEVRFKRIRNPFTVYMDPLSEEPDGSDQRRNMITSKMSRVDFKIEYPEAEASYEGFQSGTGDNTDSDWIGADFIRVAEYYRIQQQRVTLVELSNGEVGFKEDLIAMPPGVSIKRSRPSTRSKVMWFKITALEVLEKTEIKCKWIPVFPVYGDEIDIDGKVIRSGLIRNAKDPSLMYDFWMTSATEEVALRPKIPFIGAEGQFEGYEDDWNDANITSFPYLEYKPVALDGQLAPPPARQPMIDVPQGVLTMALHANDNIKATTGLFDSSLGANGNARSGVQERSQQRQGDIANFHFTDNLNRTVRHVGRCIISMLPGYYDAERVVRVMGEDDSIKPVTINQPVPQEQQDAQLAQQQKAAAQRPLGAPPQEPDPIQTVLHDMTVGEYDVTVSAGPSYSTLRQEAVTGMVALGKSWPKLMDVAGDKVVQAMDWPGATEISERIARTIPPEVRGDDKDGGQAPQTIQTPQGPVAIDHVPQILESMNQQIQQMGSQLKDAQSGLDKARIDAKAKVDVANINAASKADVAELTGLVQILVKRMAPPPPALVSAVNEDLGNDSRPPASPAVDTGASGQQPVGSSPGQEIAQ